MNQVRAIALRLRPGEDLKLSLERTVREEKIEAGCVVACTGSLTKAALRLAGAAKTTVVTGPLELVSLSGTLSPDGLHLHAAVADKEGTVTGGHLLDGTLVATTAEIAIGIFPELLFRRVADPVTGFKELEIERKVMEPDPALFTP